MAKVPSKEMIKDEEYGLKQVKEKVKELKRKWVKLPSTLRLIEFLEYYIKEKEKFISWRDKGERYYYLYDEKELIKLFKKTGFKYLKTIPHKANIIIIVKKPTSS